MVFIIRRVLQSLVVVLVMSLVVFVGVHVVGDPVHILISDDMTQQDIERFIHAAIYSARPEVNAVVHAHAEEVLPFTVSKTPLGLLGRFAE